jgi:hypothetical protein
LFLFRFRAFLYLIKRSELSSYLVRNDKKGRKKQAVAGPEKRIQSNFNSLLILLHQSYTNEQDLGEKTPQQKARTGCVGGDEEEKAFAWQHQHTEHKQASQKDTEKRAIAPANHPSAGHARC